MITLTDQQPSRSRTCITQEGDEATMLRVAVRPGGCSGFSYEMFFDTELETTTSPSSTAASRSSSTRRAPSRSRGDALDYKDGLQGAGFAINNPNAERTCGCGQSFS